MSEMPHHRRTWCAARIMIALTAFVALLVAPLVIILTHGPTTPATAALMTTEIADKVAAHDHAHIHDDTGHSHQGGLFGNHNPADHDHQFHALICQTASRHERFPDKDHYALSDAFRHLTLDGPMRPPRSV